MMNDLIARLRAATGPDRQLDAHISLLVDDRLNRIRDDLTNGNNAKERWVYAANLFGVPLYTASIDAALTLVPEGWEWLVNGGNALMGDMPWAQVWPQQISADGATPALALCIAALEARAAGAATPQESASNG